MILENAYKSWREVVAVKQTTPAYPSLVATPSTSPRIMLEGELGRLSFEIQLHNSPSI